MELGHEIAFAPTVIVLLRGRSLQDLIFEHHAFGGIFL
jgi:hypothetical protein